MTELLIGTFLGITTSFVAGLFLTWKAEKIVGYLKRLPEERRISLFTRAYIIGLRSYPYRFLHHQALLSFAAFMFLTCFLYFLITAIAFNRAYGIQIAPEPETFRAVVRSIDPFAYPITPCVLLLLTICLTYWSFKVFSRKLMPEALAPYGYHELRRVHDCVAKFGTKKQYLEYVNAENEVRDNVSLLKLLDIAQLALGEDEFKLVAQIRRGITPKSILNRADG
jgi:amino acid transporter